MFAIQNKPNVTFQSPSGTTTYTLTFFVMDSGSNPSPPGLTFTLYSDNYNMSNLNNTTYGTFFHKNTLVSLQGTLDVIDIDIPTHVAIKVSGGDALYIPFGYITNDTSGEEIGFVNLYNETGNFPPPKGNGNWKGWFDSDANNGYFRDNLYLETPTIFPNENLDTEDGIWGWIKLNKSVLDNSIIVSQNISTTPINPSTDVTFTIKLTSDPGTDIDLKVYNYKIISGTVHTENQILSAPIGVQSITLNSSNYSSGVEIVATSIANSSGSEEPGILYIYSENLVLKGNINTSVNVSTS